MSTGGFNAHTIAEFRKNSGKVGGYFEGAPLLLIHTAGKRSGKPHLIPVMYLKDGERYMVFASKAGADTHPDWFHNLKAHPDIKIEVGDQTIYVHAEEVTGRERDAIYKRQAALYPSFADYERKTKRVIPVVALTKRKK
jgi:deazaflavin-dependent oxidoreductase (nitroreductase family)